MKKILIVLFACLSGTAAEARSLVIQESARLINPDPSYPEFGGGVAIDGDDAMVVLRRYTPPDEFGDGELEDIAVWLFRRVNGTWTAIRQIEATRHGLEYIWNGDVAMQGGIAALAINPLSIYERRNGDWVQVLNNVLGDEPGTSVEVNNGRVIFGGSSGTFMGTVFVRDAAGQWQSEARLLGAERGGDIENSGGQVDISGSRAVVHSPSSENPDQIPGVTVYRFTSTFGWQQEGSSIPGSLDLWPLGRETAARGNDVFISGNSVTGTHVFRFQTTGCCDWWPEDHLQPLDGFMGGGPTNIIKKNDAFVMQNSWSADRQANVINVFAINSDTGLYRHVATLTASSGESLGSFGISGRRVMAGCGNEVCYFELPASLALPARIQEVFPGSTPTGWTLSAGSRFGIVNTGVSRVLRQAETLSPATHTATLNASNWSNQSVQADISPRTFNGSDRWFGLATRWRNASNYYYVTVRSSGRVSLRRNLNGVFREIASAPLTVILNRTYKVRLESIGTRQRVYVDGVPLLDADDDSIASGRAALLTFRTAADFDNVIASPTPTVTMYAFDLERPFEPDPGYFTESGPGLWLEPNETGKSYMTQASVAGDARAVTGVSTDDQAIDVRARATTFAGTGSGDRWFGVAARYVDTSNYYYLSLRSGNTVSLRKVNGGTVTILGTAPMPVTLGQWYRLRLEVVGIRVRAYVNGRLRLEATDATLPRGVTGFVTFRTAADFDDYRAIQP
jgi:hypothetical protein